MAATPPGRKVDVLGETETPGTSHTPKRTLTVLKLVVLAFASVAGGPFGLEESVSAAGPLYTVIGLCTVPWFWSVPMALMTAELSGMMPENGGHILWVDRAFGSFWSYQNSYWSLFCSIFEGGLYPVIFMDYIETLLDVEFTSRTRLVIGMLVILATCAINVCGMDTVASASVLFTVASLGPFLLMLMLGVPKADFTAAGSVLHRPVNWSNFITILLWNTAGYDLLGACAGEVKDPARTFPIALGYTMLLTVSLDIGVVFVSTGFMRDYESWEDGTFMEIAGLLGGNLLQAVFTIGAAISMVGFLCTLLCTCSRITYGMALVGTCPRIFATTHTTYGTPWVAMLANAACMALITFLPFTELAEVEMWFYCITTVLKFLALAKLRIVEPQANRPYRIPVSDRFMPFFVIVPCLCCVVSVVFSSTRTHLIGLIGVIIGLSAYQFSLQIKGAAKDVPMIDLNVLADI
mmetsp:Transcript_253/g.771  ORF Transcript_253/g.771 Transcript_253/m.771 type:complete len:464 (+) Transcript_253:13-1404(+)